MNTPTPRTDAAWSATFDGEQMSAGQTARALRECSQQLERELAALTAERDQLRGALALGQQNCDDAYDELRGDADELRADVVRLTAERDQLRAENATLRAAQKACEACDEPTAFEVRQLRARAEKAEAAFADPHALHAHCLRTLNEGQIAHLFGERMTEIVNRAERAEAIAGKLQELHGCSREMVVHWCEHAANRSLGLDQARSELATEREKSERTGWQR